MTAPAGSGGTARAAGSGGTARAAGSGETKPDPRRSGDFVQSLERGLAVLRSFGPGPSSLPAGTGGRSHQTLSEVAQHTGLTRAAARRFLLTLVELGYVHFDGRLFSLRPRVLELGYAYLSTLSLGDIAVPHMKDLVAVTRESSSIAVLDGEDIVYVVRVPTARIMTVAIAVGTRFPAHATSMGRVLLAALPPPGRAAYLAEARLDALTRRTVTDRAALADALDDVRTQGYSLVDQELEDGLRSIAAPIVGRDGTVQAAINVSVHATRASLDVLRRTYVPELLAAAQRISADLGARPDG
jgi:IclR family transcriptional regulator, pca regulon regulatory protein